MFVVGNYLEGRDVAIFAFHLSVHPAHERKTWHCGENPRQESIICVALGEYDVFFWDSVSPYMKPDDLESPVLL